MEAGFGILKLVNQAIDTIRKDFDGTDEEFNQKIKDKLPDILGGLEPTISKALIEYYKAGILPDLLKKEKEFNINLFEKYKEAFDHLQIFIDLNKYLGKQFLKELEKSVSDEDKLKLTILFRLHSRACQVTTEIQTLLKSGYADGAHARWRTLHEICVTFLILIKNNNRVTQMYADYANIEKLNRAKKFQKHHKKINWKPIDENKLNKLEKLKEEYESQYGKDFSGTNGWTLDIIEKKNERRIWKLEELAGLDYLRPFYSWASENVHSGMDGIANRMSLHDSTKVPYLMFTGPSQYGLADPAQFTTHSLLLITSSLISLNESYENLMVKSILEKLHETSSSEFFKKHLQIKDELKNT
jgi:hypothetical protein